MPFPGPLSSFSENWDDFLGNWHDPAREWFDCREEWFDWRENCHDSGPEWKAFSVIWHHFPGAWLWQVLDLAEGHVSS
jgi:hypothetical protein